ncbi:glycosyltransferase [Vineibacter terrae]|uniref:Glycosyltransferase n=1 Tax=Vineibacter terrae TaxID=2586908 RepID=A0A5C8PP83_9HYPH|nr:glycosyltransferase [Vineibacter terrae]TXL75672.1 glycosyltransferase [Vineibacter terrae]
MFSVVIPVYNHAQYLRSAVESGLRSDLVKEVLLVDDGSSDGSRLVLQDLCRQYAPRVRELESAAAGNRGAHYRLNELCRQASGPWIAVLNSDDEFLPGRFEVLRSLIRMEKAEFVSGTMIIVDEVSRVIGTKRGQFEPEYPLPEALQGIWIQSSFDLLRILCSQNVICTTSNMVFTKALFERLKGFRDLRYTHDWDFALRAAVHGRASFCAHPLTRYRAHSANTIKEPSPHVDGEVVRLFSWLLDEHPEIEDDPLVRVALEHNSHLGRVVWSRDVCGADGTSVGIRRVTIRQDPSDVEGYTPESSVGDVGCDSASKAAHSDNDFILRAPPGVADLGARALANVSLALAQPDYDFVIVSRSLTELPAIAVDGDTEEKTQCVVAIPGAKPWRTKRKALKGRLVRHASGRAPAEFHEVDFRDLPGLEDACWEGADVFVGGDGASHLISQLRAEVAWLPTSTTTGTPIAKLRCLVFPIFMATGGVERNTVEILRHLRDRYDFIVVTSERLKSHQGSLHHQLDELGILCLDLAEVADVDRHAILLECIRRSFEPDVVYICNGSPWLASNAEVLRRIFAKAAIVDQQVYDTEHGWIGSYRQRGIQSFDRFIATNARIKKEFVSKILIPSNRIDMIYPCINAARLGEQKASREAEEVLRAKLGIKKGQLAFGCLGRLTHQKRPLDFLDLAMRAGKAGYGDQFFLVGDGELADECSSFVRMNALTNVASIPRYENVADIVNALDGLVILSSYEGLPIVLLEALALGKPALATDVGDIALVLNEYRCGIVIDESGNPELNWRQFNVFRSSLTECKRAAEEARFSVLERFSAQAIAEQYHQSWTRAIEQVGDRGAK